MIVVVVVCRKLRRNRAAQDFCHSVFTRLAPEWKTGIKYAAFVLVARWWAIRGDVDHESFVFKRNVKLHCMQTRLMRPFWPGWLRMTLKCHSTHGPHDQSKPPLSFVLASTVPASQLENSQGTLGSWRPLRGSSSQSIWCPWTVFYWGGWRNITWGGGGFMWVMERFAIILSCGLRLPFFFTLLL